MTRSQGALLSLLLYLLMTHDTSAQALQLEVLKAQVTRAETAFAQTMADRDHAAFGRFIALEAVFFSGSAGQGQALRGRDAVMAGWRSFFDGPVAPFRWSPDQVEVLSTGDLAHSSGPVHDAQGRLIGRFNSIWRRLPDGQWQVVFDRGEAVPPSR